MEAAGNSSPEWLANAPKQRTSFGKSHCVMFDADAIGNLRKELIENLGWDAARGILERVGYQSGRNDALALRQRYPWPSGEERSPAGPRLDHLEGIACLGVRRIEINRPTGKVHMTGSWPDSYEAEQHLKLYGPGDRAVCWTPEGVHDRLRDGVLRREDRGPGDELSRSRGSGVRVRAASGARVGAPPPARSTGARAACASASASTVACA